MYREGDSVVMGGRIIINARDWEREEVARAIAPSEVNKVTAASEKDRRISVGGFMRSSRLLIKSTRDC